MRLEALLLAALLLVTPGIGTASALVWQTEIADSSYVTGAATSLALDAAGSPRISYYNERSMSMKYAWYDGSLWRNETLTGVGDVSFSGLSLKLNSTGNPRIVYYDVNSHEVKYAWHNGSTWQYETVGPAEDSGSISLALDSAGNPHISYSGYSYLTNAVYNGSFWDIRTLDPYTCYHTSIALDSAGNPRISYNNVNGLQYAWYNGSAWQHETVDSLSESMSLALDSAGRPRISYWIFGDLKYASYDGSAWQYQTVASGDWYNSEVSLALDSAGDPRISYFDSANGLKYVAWNGTAWQIETVDSAEMVGRHPSLALDSAGNPCISYYDWANLDVKYARGDSAAPALSIEASVSVDNSTTWDDADTAPGPSTIVGAPVRWRYAVTNTGNVPLVNVTVTDDQGVTVTAPTTSLAPGETMTATANGTAVAGQYTNTGTANGTYDTSSVTDSDAANHYGIGLPEAAFTADPTAGTAPLAVRFTDTSTGSMIAARSWDFGDGATSTEQSPTHTFTAAGTYTVNLTVMNAFLGSNSTTRTVNVAPRPWIAADFTANVTTGFVPLAVAFTDASTGGVYYWSWEFGDGATSTERNPVHTFTAAGTYTVRLLVSDFKSTSVRMQTVTVMDMPPMFGGDRGYFLVSTDPAGAAIYLQDISGTRYAVGTTADGPLNVTICLTCTPVRQLIATLPGYRDAVFNITTYPPKDRTVAVELNLVPNSTPAVSAIPGAGLPRDLDGDGLYEDVNGNGRVDFADVVLYFNQMSWIAANEPAGCFDFNGNTRIDFADVVWLFNHL